MDFTSWTFWQPIIAGQVRTFIAGIGGWLTLHGALAQTDQSQFTTIFGGIVLFFIASFWSAIQKWWVARQAKEADMIAAHQASVIEQQHAQVVNLKGVLKARNE